MPTQAQSFLKTAATMAWSDGKVTEGMTASCRQEPSPTQSFQHFARQNSPDLYNTTSLGSLHAWASTSVNGMALCSCP
eukprot:m.449010 g.449010  ORF g.449010 m.449010 type:complete len:78 (-) comp19752_c0_seq1:1594-1827(-)